MPERPFRPTGRLRPLYEGDPLRPVGTYRFDTPGGPEALIVFRAEPTWRLGYDARGTLAARLADAWYRARSPAGGPLLGAWCGDEWGVLLDARWVEWFGAERGLMLRRRR